MILKYKTFASTEEFEQWQQDHSVVVRLIQPIADTIQGEMTDDNTSLELSVSVFVTYTEEVNK